MKENKITEKERLEHILDAILEIESYTKDTSRELFLSNRVLIHATLFQFAIIGEAVVHLDNEILSRHKYSWHKVRGFRNFILHEYHSIEFRIVWEAVVKDLPELKKIIKHILSTEF
jgi:uncharacterized protein with HEPN domain